MDKGNEFQRMKTIKSMQMVLSDESADSNEDTEV